MLTSENKWLSIIIPCYNDEKYIDECLSSIERQILDGVEVLVIDDGSTDHSAEIIQEHHKSCPQIKYIWQDNGKQGRARNHGYEESQGDFILFLDSDDYLADDTIVTLQKFAKKYSPDFFTFNSQSFADEGISSPLPKYQRTCPANEVISGKDYFNYAVKHKECYVTAWSFCFSRQFIDKYQFRFIEGGVFEDVPYTYHMMMNAAMIVHIDKVLHKRRVRENSTMTQNFNLFKLQSQLESTIEVTKIYERSNGNLKTRKAELSFVRMIVAGMAKSLVLYWNSDCFRQYVKIFIIHPRYISFGIMIDFLRGIKARYINPFIKQR